jgi:hypothetical protein
LVIADKQRATAVRWKNPANLNGHNVVLHGTNLIRAARKTSLPFKSMRNAASAGN